MSQKLARLVGTGPVWIVVDRVTDDYFCYCYTGMEGGRLVEQGRADTAAAAVDWGRARTPRVRIRMNDARTYWAGEGAVPAGYAGRWDDLAVTRP